MVPTSDGLLITDLICVTLPITHSAEIKRFRHRGLKRLFERGDRSQVRSDQLEKIENILAVLDLASEPGGMDLPGFRLHPLKGDYAGFWAVTVRANLRIA
jgi:proteic killer suppression protein